MLKDSNPGAFAGIYVVCGYTDMLYGIDSLATIIEQRYKMDPSSPIHFFYYAAIPLRTLTS